MNTLHLNAASSYARPIPSPGIIKTDTSLKLITNYIKVRSIEGRNLFYTVVRFDAVEQKLVQRESKMNVRQSSAFPYTKLYPGHEYLLTTCRFDRDWYIASAINVGTGEHYQDHRLIQLAYGQVKIL